MSQKLESAIAVIGIDIGKNSFHVVGHDERGANKLARIAWSVLAHGRSFEASKLAAAVTQPA